MAGIKQRCEKCGLGPAQGAILKRKTVKAIGKTVDVWVCQNESACKQRAKG